MILFLEQLRKALDNGQEVAFCKLKQDGQEVIRMVLVNHEKFATHDFDLDALRQAHFPGIAFAIQLEVLREKLSEEGGGVAPPGLVARTWPGQDHET